LAHRRVRTAVFGCVAEEYMALFGIDEVSCGFLATASISALVLINGPFSEAYVGLWDQMLRPSSLTSAKG
jgi:hypothetical protein